MKNTGKIRIKTSLFFLTFITISAVFLKQIIAASFTNGSVMLSDPRPSVSSSYTLQFSGATNTTARCVKMEFSTTATGSVVPTGLGTTGVGVTVNSSSTFISGINAWSLDKSSNGTIKLTNSTGAVPINTNGTVVIDGITNSSSADTALYIKFNTYSDQSCSTGVDSNIIAYILTNGQAVTITVDPSFTFSVNNVAVGQTVNGVPTTVATTTNSIPLGAVTVGANAVAAQDLTVQTNAGHGYTIYARYTAAPTNGSYSLTDVSGTNTAPAAFPAAGNEAFGYTTSSTSLSTNATRFSANKWAKFTATNSEVGYASSPTTSAQTTRIGYQVGISGSTPAGSYTTTVILTATPTY